MCDLLQSSLRLRLANRGGHYAQLRCMNGVCPEKVLFLSALIGGSVGALAGMFAFRHKTKHLSFVLGLPAILLLHLALALWLTR